MTDKKKEAKKEQLDWRTKYPTMAQQMELFLLKFSKDDDITPQKVKDLLDGFKKYGKEGASELEEVEVFRFLESVNKTKTARELREMVAQIDHDKNRKLSFLEWACAYFGKSMDVLLAPTVDKEEIAAAEKLFAEAAALEAKKQALLVEAEEASNKKKT